MSALARWCYQHRFVVITAWIGLLIGLAVMSQAVKTSYDNSLTLPGTGSGSAQQLLLRSAPVLAPGKATRQRREMLLCHPVWYWRKRLARY